MSYEHGRHAANSADAPMGKHGRHAAPAQQASPAETFAMTAQQAAPADAFAASTQQAAPAVDASAYSRSVYGTSGGSSNGGNAPKKKGKAGRVVAIVIGVIVALLLIAGGAAFAYYQSIKSNLEYKGNKEELNQVLTQVEDKTEPFYVLVIGSDNWEGYGARSDCMLLTRVDLNTATITMVSVPRDTAYEYNGKTVKLNQVYAEEGEIACIEAVSGITGVPISHYVEVQFDQLENVVDSMGGITVNVPYAIDYQVYTYDQAPVHINAGTQTLNGQQAVALARMRTGYHDATLGIGEEAIRQANIRAMMTAMMKQILTGPVQEIPGAIQQLSAMVNTDISTEELIDWATKLAKADKVTLYSATGPYEGDALDGSGMWLVHDAPEQWAALMAAVDSGQDPATVMGSQTTSDGKVTIGTTETLSGETASTEQKPAE